LSSEEAKPEGAEQNGEAPQAPGVPLPTPVLFGASAIGPLHVEKELPCQDACAYKVFGSAAGVLAVADGLGSAPHSDVGAQAATNAVIAYAQSALSDTQAEALPLDVLAREAIKSARAELEKLAAENHYKLRHVACTIIAVVFRGGRVAIAHIGDGAVVGRTDAGLTVLSAPGETEYINEVVPLTSDDWEQALRVSQAAAGVQCLAAFTDGCQRGILLKGPNGPEPFAGFCNPLFSYAEKLDDLQKGEADVRTFLLSAKMANLSEDDKTLVVAVLGRSPDINA